MPEPSYVLAVDPDRTVLDFIGDVVQEAGHAFHGVHLGDDALRTGRGASPAAAIIRMGVPDMSGRELTARLRAAYASTPIILTAPRGGEVGVIEGLEWGAVDYMLLPLGRGEILNRLESVMQWNQASGGEGVVDLGDVAVDLDRGRLLRPEEKALTHTEREVLRRLLDPPGRAVTRRQIPVGTDRAVDVHVASLRSKLGPAGRRIQTLRGVGYRFLRPAS
jgi:DNA-binding response OmpR family regulator